MPCTKKHYSCLIPFCLLCYCIIKGPLQAYVITSRCRMLLQFEYLPISCSLLYSLLSPGLEHFNGRNISSSPVSTFLVKSISFSTSPALRWTVFTCLPWIHVYLSAAFLLLLTLTISRSLVVSRSACYLSPFVSPLIIHSNKLLFSYFLFNCYCLEYKLL